MTEVKKALIIGRAVLFDVPQQEFDIWYCPHCESLFHALDELRGKIIKCTTCHKEIELSTEIDFGNQFKKYCWLCGETEDLTEHHASPKKNDSRKNNGKILLCRTCHDHVENLKMAITTCIKKEKTLSVRNFRKILDSLEVLEIK